MKGKHYYNKKTHKKKKFNKWSYLS
jgi:hypothetical protein